jgi:hypothetical protein
LLASSDQYFSANFQLLRKECVEPGVNQMKPRRLPVDAILITVPSGIGKHVGHSSRRNNNWVKQLSHLGQVACVDSHPTSMPGHYSIENLLDQLLSSTRAKIDEVKVKYPARPIILIGWNVGAGIAVQAALMESVHSVICLGFPISTLAGNFKCTFWARLTSLFIKKFGLFNHYILMMK